MIILRYWDRNEGHVLASDYPELAEQWNYDRNGAMTPWDVTHGSKIKIWWKYSLGHEWEATIGSRTYQSNGCPYCAGKIAWPGFNDLASQRSEVAAEWNTDKNGELTPQMVVVGSCKNVWWKCSLGHEWELHILGDDPHPLAYLRTNVIVQQIDEFLETYGVQEGDAMYLAPEDRILVW